MSQCLATYFVDGGRTERRCPRNADDVLSCGDCGRGWCDEHEEHVALELVEEGTRDQRGLCADCLAAYAAKWKAIKKAAEKAQAAFWASVVESFPTAKSGDFPPDATIAFDVACIKAVAIWRGYNVEVVKQIQL